MDKISEVKTYANKLVGDWFDNAPSGQGKPLKNYTSGDGDNEGFELITNKIIKKALSVYNLEDRSEVNGDYFKDDDGFHDNQRMDNHIWIDNKVVVIEENRAWIDKPFYTLKRAVVNTFMRLPHVNKHLSKNVIFLFTSLARDVTPITESTSEYIHGHGDRIHDINLSGHPRRSNKYNYFDNGYSQQELDKYVKLICGVFSKYE